MNTGVLNFNDPFMGPEITWEDAIQQKSLHTVLDSLRRSNDRIEAANSALAEMVKTNAKLIVVLKNEVPAGIEATQKTLDTIMEGCHVMVVAHRHAQSVLHWEIDIANQKMNAKRWGQTYAAS